MVPRGYFIKRRGDSYREALSKIAVSLKSNPFHSPGRDPAYGDFATTGHLERNEVKSNTQCGTVGDEISLSQNFDSVSLRSG